MALLAELVKIFFSSDDSEFTWDLSELPVRNCEYVKSATLPSKWEKMMKVMKTKFQEKIQVLKSEKHEHVILNNIESYHNHTKKEQTPDFKIYWTYLQRYN